MKLVPVSVSSQKKDLLAMYISRVYFVGHGNVFCKEGTARVARLA
jgi:hypothetical protein